MSKKLFHGSCHCKRIQFQANIDLAKETGKCNCTFCLKNCAWKIRVDPTDFKLLDGETERYIYANDPTIGEYVSCKNCGTLLYDFTQNTQWGKESYGIFIATLDDMSIQEKANLKIVYTNGKDNTWSPITDPIEISTMY